jgi:nucleoside-diphosphate-sugar epimerase
MKTSLVCGAGAFIGSHLVKRLKNEGFWVRGVDLKLIEFSPTIFFTGFTRHKFCLRSISNANEVMKNTY